MTMFVGEGVTITCAAVDPTTGQQISNATAVVEFYAPPKNPAKVPTDRTVDHGPFTMAWNPNIENKDGTLGAYFAFVDTTGWAAGKWFYKTTLSAAFESWDYGSFKLEA